MNVYKQNIRRVQRQQCCVCELGRVGALKSVKENEKGTRLSEIKNKGEIQPAFRDRGQSGNRKGSRTGDILYPPARMNHGRRWHTPVKRSPRQATSVPSWL